VISAGSRAEACFGRVNRRIGVSLNGRHAPALALRARPALIALLKTLK
jgi:hypothetical protein